MKKTDARKLSRDAQELIRKRAIILLNEGKKEREVCEIFGVSRVALHKWKKAYKQFSSRASWLDDYALFVVLRQMHDGAPWWEWPRKYRDRLKRSLAAVRKNKQEELDIAKVIQFFFEHQPFQG